MPKPSYPIPTFLLLLFISTAFFSLVSCDSNAAITPTLRSTPQDFSFTLTFTGGKTPFTDLADFTSNTQIVLNSVPAGLTNSAVTFEALALDTDLTIFQIYLTTTVIPYASVITISFTDFSSDSSRTNYISGPVSLEIAPALATLTDKENLIKTVSKVDYVLEIVWTVMTVFNPYSLLYSDGKMYREMFDMFKRINVQHEPFVNTFFKATDRKISGLRLPNIFGILILKNDFASEWSLHPQNVLGFGDIDIDRISDLKVHVNNSVHEYDSFPLFLDNFGSELTLLVCNLILALLFEAVLHGLRWSAGSNTKDDETVGLKVFALVRRLMWNLLLLGVIGSSQSFSYYTMVQIQAFFSTNTNHNTISFAICVAVAVLTLIAVIAYVIIATIKKVRGDAGEVKILRFFDNALGFYKSQRIFYPFFILLPVIRTIISGLLTLFVENSPIAQTAIMLAISVGIIIAMVLIRPFSKLTYTVFIIIYEFITAIFLALLLVLAISDRDDKYNSNTREGLGVALIIFWIIIPILTILFCMYGLFEYYKQSQRPQGNRTPQLNINKIFPETSMANEFAQQPPQFVVEQNPPEAEKKPFGIGRLKNNTNQSRIAPATPLLQTPPNQQQPVSIMKKEPTAEQQEARKVTINEMINKKGVSLENTQRGANSEIDNLLDGNEKRNTSILLKSHGHAGEQQGLLDTQGQGRTFNELNGPRSNGVRRKFPFEPIELRLLPESHRAIDEQGFKDFVNL